MRNTWCTLTLLLFLPALGQWEVPGRIIMDGAGNNDRQVTGLRSPQATTDGVSAAADRSNAPVMSTTNGTDALSLTLTPPLSAYSPGLRVIFLPQGVNTGPVTIDIDGLGVRSVLKDVNAQLDSADLKPGIPTHVIYDGAAFQVVNQLYPGCPVGFSPVSRDVCIADLPNDTLNWYASVNLCNAKGARLCSMQEWIQGCLKYPGFVSTVTNYEWVDSGANYNNMAKNMGWTDTSTAGDCRAGSRQIPTVFYRSRCCYDR